MPRKKSESNIYFQEKEMLNCISNYREKKDPKILNPYVQQCSLLIKGMINKEFWGNSYIKNNEEDVIQECLFEIIKSMQRYDPDRGRLFAYTNRICKNTLLKIYGKSQKTYNHELTIDFFENEETEDMSMEEFFETLVYNEAAEEGKFLVDIKKYPLLTIEYSFLKAYSILSSMLSSLLSINNEKTLESLIFSMKYNVNIDFDISEIFNKDSKTNLKILRKIINIISLGIKRIEDKAENLNINLKKKIDLEDNIGRIRNTVSTLLKTNHKKLKLSNENLDINLLTSLILYINTYGEV